MSNYVSVAELQAFKINGEVIDLSMFTSDELQDALDEAEEIIERLTGDWFYSKTIDQLYDGNGLFELFFYPEVPSKVIALTSVEEVDDDGTTVLHTFTEDTDFKLYDHYIRELHLSGGLDSPRLNLRTSGRWPIGEKNIRVQGTFGNFPTPLPIIKATKYLALESLLSGSTSLAPYDVIQAVWSDFTTTFRGDSASDDSMTTGFRAIDRWIQPYVNYVDMFLAVPDVRTLSSEGPFEV